MGIEEIRRTFLETAYGFLTDPKVNIWHVATRTQAILSYHPGDITSWDIRLPWSECLLRAPLNWGSSPEWNSFPFRIECCLLAKCLRDKYACIVSTARKANFHLQAEIPPHLSIQNFPHWLGSKIPLWPRGIYSRRAMPFPAHEPPGEGKLNRISLKEWQ